MTPEDGAAVGRLVVAARSLVVALGRMVVVPESPVVVLERPVVSPVVANGMLVVAARSLVVALGRPVVSSVVANGMLFVASEVVVVASGDAVEASADEDFSGSISTRTKPTLLSTSSWFSYSTVLWSRADFNVASLDCSIAMLNSHSWLLSASFWL
ncbi:uncharacterized protein LOC125488605 [Plutella xylostella]|uniref:uncharacterized protein LOC125488605 n=1 Tax=Plutella xylostella TaxID=51655 RepID=UPI00203276C6|nr:uncharacterized protein LOC125488605 [Plutella xylostella]